MRVLASPVPMLLRAWDRSGWRDVMAVRAAYLPDPGDFVEFGQGQCLRVRHLAADVSLGNEQIVVYGHLVGRPPR